MEIPFEKLLGGIRGLPHRVIAENCFALQGFEVTGNLKDSEGKVLGLTSEYVVYRAGSASNRYSRQFQQKYLRNLLDGLITTEQGALLASCSTHRIDKYSRNALKDILREGEIDVHGLLIASQPAAVESYLFALPRREERLDNYRELIANNNFVLTV